MQVELSHSVDVISFVEDSLPLCKASRAHVASECVAPCVESRKHGTSEWTESLGSLHSKLPVNSRTTNTISIASDRSGCF